MGVFINYLRNERNYMELGIGIFFIVLALVYKLFIEKKHKKSEYLSEQADRYFNKRNEMTQDWNSNGMSYTKGISLIKTDENEYKFIKQSKICDTAILH